MTQETRPPRLHHPPPLAAYVGRVPEAPGWFAQALADAPQRSVVKVQGAQIETLAWGRVGDPGLMLLHGNGAHADWYSFIAPLLRRGRRVVAMSLSGMGGSDWRTQYSIAQWADEVSAVARASGLMAAAVPPVLVGHSFGGFPVLNLAARSGADWARAWVVDTPLRPPSRSARARRPRADTLRSARVYDSQADALARFRFLPAQGCALHFVADLIARRGLKQVTGPQGRSGWAWRFDPFLFRHFDFGHPLQDLARAACPLTLLRGGRSQLVSADLLAWMASQSPAGTELLSLADADHHLMVDQPLAFAALLDQRLARAAIAADPPLMTAPEERR